MSTVAKHDIEAITQSLQLTFKSEVLSCGMPRSFVLSVEFRDKTDLSNGTLRERPDDNFYSSEALIRLADAFPVVEFKNAFVCAPNNLVTTGMQGEKYKLAQDPPHRDLWRPHENSGTLLYMPPAPTSGRNVPTWYATEASFRRAIAEMQFPQLDDSVMKALTAMQQPDYTFDFTVFADTCARKSVTTGYEDFTADVLEAIPEEDKYEHYWTGEQDEVVMHSNKPGSVLHCRTATNLDMESRLMATSFVP